MNATEINSLFQRFSALRMGVIGDFALDLYFDLQTETGERSLETGRDVFWGSQARASLGAAGNVVQNLAALGVSNIQIIGLIGDDLFGREMQHLFAALGANTQQLHVVTSDWDTCVYTKPNRAGQETNRIDFGTANILSDVRFADLITGLESSLNELDVLLINQQFAHPLLSEKRMDILNNVMIRFPTVRYVADMRHVGRYVRGAILKVNTAELANFLNIELPAHPDLDWCVRHGNAFRQHSGGPLLITRGQAGILYLDHNTVQTIDGLPLQGELDTVGAGDTVVATWAACLGVGASPMQALEIANLAAAVTVQKLAQTGTASLSEILHLHHTYSAHD